MNKIKFYKYANKYLDILNNFYDTYKNIINENVLDKEYDLVTNILDDLIYNHNDTWYANFGGNKYHNHIIYKVNKKYWKMLSKLYKKMLKHAK